jgi:hypothetical protein
MRSESGAVSFPGRTLDTYVQTATAISGVDEAPQDGAQRAQDGQERMATSGTGFGEAGRGANPGKRFEVHRSRAHACPLPAPDSVRSEPRTRRLSKHCCRVGV